MHRLRWLLIAVLLGPLAAPPADAGAGPAGPAMAALDAALARAVGWVERHPATPTDGGLAEMVDERLLLLLLGQLSRDPGERERFAGALRAHVARLEHSGVLDGWVRQPAKTLWDHYHLALAAHLARRAGHPSALGPAIAAGARQALADAPGQHPSARLALALLLEGLGEPPGIPLESLLGASLIERIAREGRRAVLPGPAGGADPVRVRLALYALVHELLALTELGRAPAPPWLAARRDGVREVLAEAVGWARQARDVDLACELAVTGKLLGLLPADALATLARDLLAGQQADGSWGASPTTRLHNRTRHAVLTAIAALWAYRNARP